MCFVRVENKMGIKLRVNSNLENNIFSFIKSEICCYCVLNVLLLLCCWCFEVFHYSSTSKDFLQSTPMSNLDIFEAVKPLITIKFVVLYEIPSFIMKGCSFLTCDSILSLHNFRKSSKQAASLRIFKKGNSLVASVYRLDMVYFLRNCLIKPNSVSI